MTAADLTAAPPVTVDPTTTTVKAALRIEQEAVGCVLVTDHGRLSGTLTDRGLPHGHHPEQLVTDLMTTPVTIVDADDDLDTAYRTFRSADVHRLPVLDHGRVAGMLADGAVRRFADEQGVAGEHAVRDRVVGLLEDGPVTTSLKRRAPRPHTPHVLAPRPPGHSVITGDHTRIALRGFHS
ncbi:CBS domain-containing protein [Streptomyces sp. CBMA123]|uniref:CBS domain-containing protein n=1 Tax=Streptomyces sp. CBMA123 TaxID=1896313 RepID=UPI0016619489|nr:CBS domain-containing protein [Streptomyces sp. CBMA123]MBD0694940.1 hypothetical protein [Streptomyces sp. CBMA123]